MRTRRSQSSSDPVLPQHRTVLLHESVDVLHIEPADTILDGTLGASGHAREIAGKLGPAGTFVGFDLDQAAIAYARSSLAGALCKVELFEDNFRHLRDRLTSRGIAHIDGALFDLGWSADQLERGRGFSFLKDEPLRMTYRTNPGESETTAATIVNEWSEESIADVLFGWGQERYARRIAKAIVVRRLETPIETAHELAEIVISAIPPAARRGKIHPATRTFQALRIAVNDELGALEEGAASAWQLLNPGGRLAIITFHSIEDGVVKRLFAQWERDGQGQRRPKKFIEPSMEEVASNPRARSAKLRVIEKGPQFV